MLSALDRSAVRGLGGAGFPAGRKWRSVRGEPGPRLMAVNGDEGEPGTFKDRHLPPHRSAPVSRRDADRARSGRGRRTSKSISRRIPGGPRDPRRVKSQSCTRRTAPPSAPRGRGAYICGEESSLIEASRASGACRATSRPSLPGRPFRPPDLINNVETLFWVRDIVEKGADWWAASAATAARACAPFRCPGGSETRA